MVSYRLITSGKNQRREYLSLNRSPLFEKLPDRDFAEEQKESYKKFLKEKLPQLLTFYFPAEFSDYNNNIRVNIESVECQEPKISEEEARVNFHTWSYSISFLWTVAWVCQRMEIPLSNVKIANSGDSKILSGKIIDRKELEEINKKLLKNKEKPATFVESWAENIRYWVEESFKIGKFTLKEKSAQKWEIKEAKGNLKILLEVLESNENNLTISFHCEQAKRTNLCSLPKINQQGNFIINGHDKVVVFQSVRAPAIYHFSEQENSFYSEIIPLKGPWISVSYNAKKSQEIELKFLNSGLTINFLSVLKTFAVELELLENLFSPEDLSLTGYQKIKPLEVGISLPQFLFTKENSYFKIGKLGRKKYNQKITILSQVVGQTLTENLYDKNKKLILKKNDVLDGENFQKLKKYLNEKKMNSFTIPHSNSELYLIKIKSPRNPEKIIPVIGLGEEEPAEEKNNFDLADLICIVANHINLYHDLGKGKNIEKEEDKDKLENQVVRRVGDLVYNMFDNKLGGFLQDIDNRYLSAISQLKKVDLLKIPNLKDFDNLIRHFFNTSALVQLQNQNNPLAEISYARKLSVLGLGGFSSSNTTLAARNINSSYCGRYDLVETPEGQRVGLVHNLTINSEINEEGQVTTVYYRVQQGVITTELVYLTSEEEWDEYITHPALKINEKNEIIDLVVPALHQGKLIQVPKEKINYIYSSFHQLNSPTTATIPAFAHNDATRILMAANMQRQAVPLLINQEPLVASGIEASLFRNSPLTVKVEEQGQVEYVDSQEVIIKGTSKKKWTYKLQQLVVSNKNILNFSQPLVKKGEKVEKDQVIACGGYASNGELSLGYNLRVAYLSLRFNYEDAFVINERLIKDSILNYFFVKKHTIIRRNTKYGPEVFTNSLSHFEQSQLTHLDKNGIAKIGSEVKENDILVGKITPQPSQHQETEEESLLRNLLGEKAQRFVNSSLRLPVGEKGTVYEVKRRKLTKSKNELEIVEIYIAHERKIEPGDKLTTRFGNKGVVAKIIPEIDMPFDKDGKTIDIIFNPLGVPSRMNIGQLLENTLALAAKKINTKFLLRPFNTPSLEVIKEIMQEAKIKDFGTEELRDGQSGLPFQQKVFTGYMYVYLLNHKVADKLHVRSTGPYSLIYQQALKGRAQGGGQRLGEMEINALEGHGAFWNIMEKTGAGSDDMRKRKLLQSSLLHSDRQIDLRSNQSESFNLILQFLRGIGFDLRATDQRGQEIDFYKYFSKN